MIKDICGNILQRGDLVRKEQRDWFAKTKQDFCWYLVCSVDHDNNTFEARRIKGFRKQAYDSHFKWFPNTDWKISRLIRKHTKLKKAFLTVDLGWRQRHNRLLASVALTPAEKV